MYQTLLNRLREALATHVREKYSAEIGIVLERPPKLELGEAASPLCFELAKRLKKAPRAIAQEIAASLPKVEGIARVEVAGGGLSECVLRSNRILEQRPPRIQRRYIARQTWPRDRRAHQHQPQQGRAHRSPAQRRAGRHHGSSASPQWQKRRGTKLH